MLVNTILIHYPAELCDAMFETFSSMAAEDARFLLAYGGPHAEFAKIQYPDKIFFDDLHLRGQASPQNSWPWLKAASEWTRSHAAEATAVHFTECDHLVFRSDYWRRMEALLLSSGKDFLGKDCFCCSNTNFHFFLEYRDDPTLLALLGSISKRDDPTQLWTALGNGMLFRREALEALVAATDSIPCYTEILIPSVLFHTGRTLGSIDEISEQFDHVRFRPNFSSAEVLSLMREGTSCCHPFKDRERLPELLDKILERHRVQPS